MALTLTVREMNGRSSDSGYGIAGLFLLVVLAGYTGDWIANTTKIVSPDSFLAFILGLFAVIAALVAIALALLSVYWVRKRHEAWKPCAHGVRGGLARGRCSKCADEQRAAEERARRTAEAAQRRQEIAASAKQLKSEEVLRLRQTIAPSIAELRRLSPQRFEDEIARMFERLGYAVKQTPYANDYGRDAILMKAGEKFLLECKKYADDGLSGRPDLQKFHSAIISDKAKRGFFVTTGGFTSGAVEFAATAPIDLIGAHELLRLMFKSVNGVSQDDSYSSRCLECGDVVKHHIRSPENALCRNGHTVPATLSIDDLLETDPRSQQCARCGAPTRLVNGKKGKFWGCTKYPECRHTRPFRRIR